MDPRRGRAPHGGHSRNPVAAHRGSTHDDRRGLVGETNLRRAAGDSGHLAGSGVRLDQERESVPNRPATRGRDPEEIPSVGGLDRLEFPASARASRERPARRGLEAGTGIARIFRAARSLARGRHGGPVARRKRATPVGAGAVLPPVRLGSRDDGGSARPSVSFGVGRTLIPDSRVSTGMRPVVVVLGVILLLAGAVWALQGAGYLLGSFMSNDRTWLWIGIVTALAGVGIVAFGVRTGRVAKSS